MAEFIPCHLGRRPGVYTNYDANEARKVHRVIFAYLKQGLPFADACWAAQVDPTEIQNKMAANAHVRAGFKHVIALVQLDLVKTMREGGGLKPAQVAKMELQANHLSWAAASDATLAKKFEDALEQLSKMLDAPTYEKVVRVLERFA